MTKILIVDDTMAADLMNRHDNKKNISDWYDKFDLQIFEKRLNFANNNPYFDLTKQYHDLGGKKSREICVLSSPAFSFSPNVVYDPFIFGKKQDTYYRNHPDEVNILRRNFDFIEIVKKIKNINPDILLLDLGITATVPDDKRLELKDIYSQKEKSLIELVNVPLKEMYPERFNGSFLEYSPQLRYKEQLDYNLDCAGGVILGHYLMQEQIPFRLWTADYGHGKTNMILAHVFDLISTNDLNDFMTGYALKLRDTITSNNYYGFFTNTSKNMLSGLKDNFRFIEGKNDFFQGDIRSIDLILDGMD